MSTPMRVFRYYFCGRAYEPVDASTESMALHAVRETGVQGIADLCDQRVLNRMQEHKDDKWYWCVGGREFKPI